MRGFTIPPDDERTPAMPDAETSPGESTAVILARMEVKLDQALTGHADHEARIRVLERKVWAAAAFAIALGSTGGAGIAQILGR